MLFSYLPAFVSLDNILCQHLKYTLFLKYFSGRVAMKNHRVACWLLIIGCALPVLLLWSVFITGEKDISRNENRTLARFPALNLSDFISGRFQDGLENALGDQYPLGDSVKTAVLDIQNHISAAESSLLKSLEPDSGFSYTEISQGFYHYADDEHRIVEKPWDGVMDASHLASAANLLEDAGNVRKFVFFVRNTRAQDFTASETENNTAFSLIRTTLRADAYDQLAAADYEEFCSLFYQTDHHWNCLGADRGYRQVLAMMCPDETPLSPDQEWSFNVVFNGSYARKTRLLCADEHFRVYSYPVPKMKTALNGKNGQYGHQSVYEKDRYPTDELRNHYAYYYGGDYGEIRIDSGRSGGRNLLMIADSYSNPINLLLASHFDRTCVIDLRYYEKDIGVPFDISRYISEHRITDVLLLGDIAFFADAQEEVEN